MRIELAIDPEEVGEPPGVCALCKTENLKRAKDKFATFQPHLASCGKHCAGGSEEPKGDLHYGQDCLSAPPSRGHRYRRTAKCSSPRCHEIIRPTDNELRKIRAGKFALCEDCAKEEASKPIRDEIEIIRHAAAEREYLEDAP